MAARAARKMIEGHCAGCGRQVRATAPKKVADVGPMCCGSLMCDALVRWTEDEWRCRASSAARQPGWRRGQRLDIPTTGWCWCAQPDGARLFSFVIAVDEVGRATLAAACMQCMGVYRTWIDDPTVRGGGDVHRWLDAEALRRFPTTVAPYVVEPEPVRLAAAAVAPPAPVEAPSTPEPAPEPAAPVPAPVLPVRTGPPVCLLAERDGVGWHSKCGTTVKVKRGEPSLIEAGMTGWGSKVTCQRCLGTSLSAVA